MSNPAAVSRQWDNKYEITHTRTPVRVMSHAFASESVMTICTQGTPAISP